MDDKKQELKDVLLSLAQNYGLSAGEFKDLAAEVTQELEKESDVPQEQEVIQTTSAQIEVGYYAFAGGKFSKDPNAYPNCQGVVAWLNPDPNAPIGKRGLILMPDAMLKLWADKNCETGIGDEEDGHANTKGLIAYGKEHGVSFPAAEWCYAYSKNGVKPGEGFLAAKKQLEWIVANCDAINSSLEKIGGKILKNWIWSSFESCYTGAWCVFADYGNVDWDYKKLANTVRCVLAF